jgi:hypothetical protein
LELGDPRLDQRGKSIASRVAQSPQLSFPNLFPSESELEAFYRFLRNEKVSRQKLLEPHVQNTVERIRRLDTAVLCLHDTTTFTFEGRGGLGLIEGGVRGFLAHCSLAVTAEGTPLGALNVHSWQRDASKPSPTKLRKSGVSQEAVVDMPSEMDRWGESVEKVEKCLAQPGVLIHVADSEGDDYRLLALLGDRNYRYVVRGCYDRRIIDREHTHLRARLVVEPPAGSRSVDVAARGPSKTGKSRRHPLRPARSAEVEIRAASLTLKRPDKLPASVPAEVALNVVYVLEVGAPEGQPPIEWVLLTSESIQTREAILAVIDTYRRRWMIEEFFKALKTGCAYELRQLETLHTLDNALAIFVPVAWQLLCLRALERKDDRTAVESCFSADQVAILREKSSTPVTTVVDALAVVARLGGHIKNNGRPGWLVLWRGFHDLLLLAQGFALARKCIRAYSDQS